MARRPVSRSSREPSQRGVKLTDEARAFIVVQLACYRTLEAIRQDVKKIFGVEVTQQAINHYDPTTKAKSAAKWEDLFNSARKQYLEDVQQEPLAYQRHRLRLLQETIDAARPILTSPLMHTGEGENAKPVMVASPLEAAEQIRKAVETAAKELGGVFTNVKKGSLELTGTVAVSSDEKRNVLEDKLKEIIEGRYAVMKPAKAIEKG